MAEAATAILPEAAKCPACDGAVGESRYRYRTISIAQFHEVQQDFLDLMRAGAISLDAGFRDYLGQWVQPAPESFPEARSMIVMARTTRMARVCFQYFDRRIRAVLPPQYFDDGVTRELLHQAVRQDILGGAGSRLEAARGVPAKTLAVRSGLGRYGKNNLCYVDGMGSFAALHCFITDKEFPGSSLTPAAAMDACQGCSACRKSCPTQCIVEGRFTIYAERCLSMHNEREGHIPDWIPAESHHALFGCLRCQMACPVNRGLATEPRTFEDITHEETVALLSGDIGGDMLEAVARKLHLFNGEYLRQVLPVLSRNLGLLTGATPRT